MVQITNLVMDTFKEQVLYLMDLLQFFLILKVQGVKFIFTAKLLKFLATVNYILEMIFLKLKKQIPFQLHLKIKHIMNIEFLELGNLVYKMLIRFIIKIQFLKVLLK